LEEVSREMEALGAGPKQKSRAVALVRRFARARQQRADSLARVSAWLEGTGGQG
jgi:hypothetical protein